MKHTPGPWFVHSVSDGREPSVFVTREFGEGTPTFYVAFLPPDAGDSARYPNAHLIAAAPQLLAACERALGTAFASDGGPAYMSIDTLLSVRDELRAAIAKATDTL